MKVAGVQDYKFITFAAEHIQIEFVHSQHLVSQLPPSSLNGLPESNKRPSRPSNQV
jgi:hypothetical protein